MPDLNDPGKGARADDAEDRRKDKIRKRARNARRRIEGRTDEGRHTAPMNPEDIPLDDPIVLEIPPQRIGNAPTGGDPPPYDHAPNDGPVIPPIPPPRRSPDHVDLRVMDRARAAAGEILRRRQEALRLYEPLPEQERFHASRALIRLILGGNRGGKTTPSAVEVARAVTGQDPHNKWPKEDGSFIIVGKGSTDIGKVMYPRLFMRRRNFLIIRDAATGLWRAWRPWDANDVARRTEARAAPPLIPARFVKRNGMSWYSKKDNVPRVISLVNGWELYFYSSESDPPSGYSADGAWFDEEILRGEEWVEEVMARLVDRAGRFIWSATPQNATEQLYDLHQQAEKEVEQENPNVAEFTVHIDQNSYLPKESVEKFKERMRHRGDAVYAVRVEGRFAIEGYRVYPEYGPHLHWPRFVIPDDWTLYAVVDPGRQVCAVLFLAIPPPDDPMHGGHKYFCDELYVKEADARKFASGMADKLRGRVPRAFIIDKQEARKHDTGSGATVEMQYSKALRKKKVYSYATNYSFSSAPADPKGNRESLREWMCPDERGFAVLRVFSDLTNFHREMKNYHVKRDKDGLPTDEVVKKNDHLVDCAGYAAGLMLGYKAPPKIKSREERGILKALERRRRKRPVNDGGRRNFINIGKGQ